MNVDFLDEPYFTIRALSEKYGVAYQTAQKWVEEGRFSRPDTITVYKLPGDNKTRITQSGVDYFNTQITVVGGAK